VGETIKKIVLIILFLIIIPLTLAEEPRQTTNTVSLQPYYLTSLNANTDYYFNLTINPPDGFTKTTSAILKFTNYMTPAITYTLTLDNKTCQPTTHTISTTYSNSEQALITFDCTQTINKTGTYQAKLRTNKNTGSITGWLEHTYINKPTGKMEVFGTEYTSGQQAKIWLQLINSTGSYVNNAVCYADIYSPQNTEYLEKAQMDNLNHDGIYYYDLLAPNDEGVYPVIASCFYIASEKIYNATNYFTQFGTYDSGTINDTHIQDGNFLRFKETTTNPIRNITVGLNFTNLTTCSQIPEVLLTNINIHTHVKFDSVANDNITMHILNHTNNQWITLPNEHLESPAFTTTSNTINTNNITASGLYNESKGGIILKFNDTSLNDGGTSNLDIDNAYISCNALSNSDWQEVKGSSEIHVSLNQYTNLSNEINMSLENLTNITQTNQNMIQQIINYLNNYLTGMIDQINATTTENSFKLDLLLNATNITTNSINIAIQDNTPCITGETWLINATVTGYYGQPLTNSQATCSINTTAFGYANMTYITSGLWEYTNTCPNPTNWSWQVECV
jgi:hypothetical protein